MYNNKHTITIMYKVKREQCDMLMKQMYNCECIHIIVYTQELFIINVVIKLILYKFVVIVELLTKLGRNQLVLTLK